MKRFWLPLILCSLGSWLAQADGTLAIQVTPAQGSWQMTAFPDAYTNATSGTGSLEAVPAPTGIYAIAFNHLPGYQTPPAQTNVIVDDEELTFSGVYLPLGSLSIQVTPAQGSWQLTDYPAAYTHATSGTGSLELVAVPTGTYGVVFQSLIGHRTPPAQTNSVQFGRRTLFNGAYHRYPAVLDFDGDYKTDLCAYDYPSGYWYILLSGTKRLWQGQFGGEDYRPVPADYDGDGRTDPALYQESTGLWGALLSSRGHALVMVPFGGPGLRPVPADYDGDGRADPALFNCFTGEWFVLASRTGQLLRAQFGWGNARPVPADYDGDGRADLAFYERNNGDWFIHQSATGKLVRYALGRNEARPVPADYNGDGCAQVAMYFRPTGFWYVMNTKGALDSFWFGGHPYRAVPGDYDGDGCSDAAVYEQASGMWYAKSSASGRRLSACWGLPTTMPLARYTDGAGEGLVMLAFGDSITYGGGSSSGGPASGYPVLLERALSAACGGHFVSINAGEPGETTEEGLGRYTALLQAINPDVVLLMEGTNDQFFGDPYDHTEDNLRAMVLIALQHGCRVVLATIPPVISNAYRDRGAQQARIRGFNPRIHQIAADYGIPLALVYEAITAVPGWERELMDQASANHPNDAGYRVIRDAFLEAVISGINAGLFF